MSAFVCSSDHINLLVSAGVGFEASYLWEGRRHYIKPDPQAIAAKLYKANVESVNYRYGDNEPTDGFEYQPWGQDPEREVFLIGGHGLQKTYAPPILSNVTAVSILKQCDCFDYQACEVDGYESTEAAAIINGIREAAIRNLPGYDNAPWGI